jgi:hypothetical protein
VLIYWRKNQEYLVIRLYQDLVGDWVVSQTRGIVQSTHKEVCTHTVMNDYMLARSLVISLNKEMRAQGYKKTISSEEQLGFRFE